MITRKLLFSFNLTYFDISRFCSACDSYTLDGMIVMCIKTYAFTFPLDIDCPRYYSAPLRRQGHLGGQGLKIERDCQAACLDGVQDSC